jgi:hypothetical protein
MKRTCLLLVMLAAAAPSLGGPNSGGILVIHDAGVTIRTSDLLDCRSGSVPGDCAELDTQVDAEGLTSLAVFRVYAAFPPAAQPRLVGVSWGIDYDPAKLEIIDGFNCADSAWPDAGWPQAGTGDLVAWNSTQLGHMVPVCAFAAYTEDPIGDGVSVLSLGPHPTQGGFFVDDTIVPLLTPIEDYGRLGFHTPGYGPCFGACCARGGCWVATSQNCARTGDTWLGSGTSCTPDPCFPVPVGRMSWGRIKNRYR